MSPILVDDILRLLLEAAVSAPSGDNAQPWRLRAARRSESGRRRDRKERRLDVLLAENDDRSAMNAGQRMSRLALGAAVENVVRQARRIGLGADLVAPAPGAIASIAFSGEPFSVERDPLLFERATNRRLYDRRPVGPETLERLRAETMAVSELTQPALMLAARRAYERGRVEGALWRGAAAAILAMPSFAVCNQTPWAAVCLAGFAIVVAAGRFRGLGYEEGTRAGALAGILPCLLPAAARAFDPELCVLLSSRGPWLCAAGGVAAGVILARRGLAARGLPFWSGAIGALGFAAALGCLPAGALGFAGLAAGIVAGGAPVLVSRRASI